MQADQRRVQSDTAEAHRGNWLRHQGLLGFASKRLRLLPLRRAYVCRETLVPDGGVVSGGKVCTDAWCTDDSQCSSGQVCRKDFTTRVPDDLICAPPCVTDLGCAPTDKCDNSGHCRARTCAECPSYYSCASGTCVIPSCSTDNDCPGGYCVAMISGTGTCSGSLGSCRMMCF